MGSFTAETIYDHMQREHGGIHGDEPEVDPEPVFLGGLQVDYREQERLLREAQLLRQQQLRQEQDYRRLRQHVLQPYNPTPRVPAWQQAERHNAQRMLQAQQPAQPEGWLQRCTIM